MNLHIVAATAVAALFTLAACAENPVAPVSNTANVWPVIGTGHIGITTCADAAVSRLKIKEPRELTQ